MRFTLVLSIALVVLVGCSAHPQLVENLPPPNFNGPNVAPQAGTPLPAPAAPRAPAVRQPQMAQNTPRDWAPLPGASRSWTWIVIHHSATSSGSARMFDNMHRAKGWDELGYHFVIGNGTDSGDGQIEVGPRWPTQKWGAHAKTADNRFNDFGIGICLVGNFDLERPTAQQTRALARLVGHLMTTYNIPAERILGHSQTKPTECPGRNINIAAIRRMAAQIADSGLEADDGTQIAASIVSEDPAFFNDLPGRSDPGQQTDAEIELLSTVEP